MKRILALFLSVLILISCFSCYTFADEPNSLNFSLSVDGETEIFVEAGDEIVVDVYVSNLSDGSFNITNMQTEVEYDDSFFEFDEEDVEYVKATTHAHAEYSWGAKRVQLRSLHVGGSKPDTYENEQLFARVTFKVKDGLKEGTSGKLTNKACEAADGINKVTYNVSSEGMTVYIGSKSADTYKVTYKSGNSVVHTDNSVEAGSEISVYSAVTAEGKKFGGWLAPDGKIYNPGDKFEVNEDVTFEAVFLDKSTLSFDTDGGQAVEDITSWDGDTVDISEITSKKDGYVFDGWYSDKSYTTKLTSVKMDGDTTVYAKWKDVPTYTLRFETNGGNKIDDFVSAATVVDLSDYVPTKTGHTFSGWYFDKELSREASNVELSADTTVYAKWVKNFYTLTFVTNGGGSVAVVSKEYESVINLDEYTTQKDGHEFISWCSDAGLTVGVSSIVLTQNTTVYAKWAAIYSLTFITDGGTPISRVSAREGSTIDLSKYVTTKDKHVFGGWYLDDAFKKPVASIVLSENTSVYAKWIKEEEKTFKLSFNTSGGKDITPITDVEGTIIDLSDYTPTRSGYKFKGWYSDSDLTQIVTSVTLTQDITVYAKWEKSEGGGGGGGGDVIIYTLTFNTDGGSVIKNVEKLEKATVDLTKYVPVKEGYTFEGWYADAQLTVKVTSVKMTGDITVYAKWISDKDDTEDGKTDDKKDDNKDETDKPASDADNKPAILTDEHFAYIVGREDGKVYPKANITRAEAATIFFRLLKDEVRDGALTKENTFTDVNEGQWFNTAVSTLAKLGIINGRTETTFAPNEPITRAELTTIVARLSEKQYSGESKFSDVSGHWAEGYINLASSMGWVEGDGDGTFRPNDKITRAEVMTLINRVLNRVPLSAEDMHKDMTKWPDNMDTNAWYYIAVQEATNSHDCEYADGSVHEKWTKLTENRDWSVYQE